MILLSAQIEGIRTRKDRTISINIGTQELSPVKAGELLTLSNKVCFVAIKDTEISKEETDLIDNANVQYQSVGKSKSQKLRAVFHVLYGQNTEGYSTFNAYYDSKMETLIEHYKNKIQP